MAIADKLFDGLLWHRDCAAVINNLEGGAWATWTPTYGGSGALTYTTVTTNYAKYIQQGKKVWFALSAIGTTGGVASPNISFTLPVTAADANGLTFSAWTSDAANPIGGTARGASTTIIYVAKYDYGNWALGANRAISVSGVYEAA